MAGGRATTAAGMANTEMMGAPDYLDDDADGDGVPDATEAHDAESARKVRRRFFVALRQHLYAHL